MLELDHLFFIVDAPEAAVRRLEGGGWSLDAGQAHRGQGTRNRRVPWTGRFFELLWVTDAAEARANPLRLDRRAEWATTGASPVGLAFRGRLDPQQREDFWLYDALGFPIWIHRDNERHPERPLVFVLDVADGGIAGRQQPGELRELVVRGPSPPSLPRYAGRPRITCEPGAHGLELVAGDGGVELAVADGLVIRR